MFLLALYSPCNFNQIPLLVHLYWCNQFDHLKYCSGRVLKQVSDMYLLGAQLVYYQYQHYCFSAAWLIGPSLYALGIVCCEVLSPGTAHKLQTIISIPQSIQKAVEEIFLGSRVLFHNSKHHFKNMCYAWFSRQPT